MTWVVGAGGGDKGVDLAVVFPAGEGGERDTAEVGGLGGSKEIFLGLDRAVLDGIEDLEIFETVAALIAEGPTGAKTTGLFPATQSFVGEIELGGYFGDGVEFVHTCTSRVLSKFVGGVFSVEQRQNNVKSDELTQKSCLECGNCKS